MTKYSIEEQKILDDLDIKNFRQVNKNNLVNLYSELKNVTPEVAEKVLEQVRNFTNLAGEAIKDYKDLAGKALESAKGSQTKVYEAKLQEIAILQEELKQPRLKFDQKMQILDRIHTVGLDMQDIDVNHKSFILNFLAGIGKIFLSVLGAVVLIITGKNYWDNKS